MQKAEIVLNIVSNRGERKLPLERVYRLLFNKELYLLAYQNIYSNNGVLTKGVNDETIDGMSEEKNDTIIEYIRREAYQWMPVRRVYINKKKNSTKKRPLGLPTWSDKLVQEVIRLILNTYYDPQFSDKSHGFRENRGCQSALEAIRYKDGWKSVKWFVEGDISDCFGSINHDILLSILAKNIKDNRFLEFIRNFLKCGYMENWQYNKTMSGCPQGGILSPLLSNIYMDKLDQFVVNTLMPKYTLGTRRAENEKYTALKNLTRKFKRNGNWQMVKEIRKTIQRMPSKDPNDPKFKRLYYIRYADDWLIGLSGSQKDADAIKLEIKDFLQNELKLNLSEEKTLITHAKTQYARFLSYNIHVLHCDTAHDKRGQRSINGAIGLKMPDDKLKDKMAEYMRGGRPIHKKERSVNSDYDIVAQYQAEFRGFAQYYLLAYNAHKLGLLKRTMELSLAMTLANKHKTTINKIFRKYGKWHDTKDGKYKVLLVEIQREGQLPLLSYFGGIKLAYNKSIAIDEKPEMIYNSRTSLICRLMGKKCELCGAETKIAMHHVRKLKDLYKSNAKERPEWMKRMIAIRRKTLAVCETCHNDIHYGRYDGKKIAK